MCISCVVDSGNDGDGSRIRASERASERARDRQTDRQTDRQADYACIFLCVHVCLQLPTCNRIGRTDTRWTMWEEERYLLAVVTSEAAEEVRATSVMRVQFQRSLL